MDNNQKQTALIFISFLFFSYLIYWNTLKISFFLDDTHMISFNAYIKNFRLWPYFFKGFVTSCPIGKGMVRPLLMITFSANYYLTGLNPYSYHLVNIFMHFLVGLMLMEIIKLLSSAKHTVFLIFAGLLFLAHPLHNETVNYLSCRSDLLVTLCLGFAMASYLSKRYFFTVLWYILALASKENALCLPMLIAAYELIFRNIDKGYVKKTLKSRKGICIIILFILSAGYWWYRSEFFASSLPTQAFTRTHYENILTQSGVTFLYLKMFFLPYPLVLAHDFPILSSFFDLNALFPVIGIIVLCILILLLRKKEPLISFGLAWFLICLIPKFYTRLNFVACEHHFYLPSLGLFMVVYALLVKTKKKYFNLIIFVGVIVLIVFVFLGWKRNREWNDSFFFWKTQTIHNPGSALSHINLASLYDKRGELELARNELVKAEATAVMPYAKKVVKVNLARIDHIKGDNDQALALLDGFFDRPPIPVNAYSILGSIHKARGDMEKAVEAWEREVKLFPQSPTGYIALSNHYLGQKDFERAERYLIQAIQINPDLSDLYFNLGYVNEQKKQFSRALALYNKALSLNPGKARENYHLGSLMVKTGDKRGIDYFKRAIEIDPHYGSAYNDLAVAYSSMDPPQWKLAEKFAALAQKQGFAVSPDFLQYLSDHKQ